MGKSSNKTIILKI